MDVEKILRCGYFDTVKIDGVLQPVYNSFGTKLYNNLSFKDDLNISEDKHKHGIAVLKISLIGEINVDMSFDSLEEIRNDLRNNNIQRLNGNRSRDRYLIGYINILILKSDYTIPFGIQAIGKTEDDIKKLDTSNDIFELLIAAINLEEYINSVVRYPRDYINIAVIDKVYVSPLFRRCGISTWLHSNIADIINLYGMVFPTGIVMRYGDFANEARDRFGMTEEAYSKMLYNHYKSLGYCNISKLNIKNLVGISNILYKLNTN